ncbi:hypothetical protein DPMN_116517 [Dreissena polymorpha]|uniref:Immunoglobulin subtype domain-containing protein n=1 Tax=Dreissena polymorpha TaxID=45954 RepID=A0A9D4KPZ6_DREPO|nr:hypothetical protein DPMN_116517 [Dreissena polymorpha]
MHKMLCCALVFILFFARTTQGASESFKVEYYKNITLPCNFTKFGITYPGLPWPFKKYWILPNATILDDTYAGDNKYTIIRPLNNFYDFYLHIREASDAEFGVYHCLMIWENVNYRMNAIRVAVNEEGPYYQKKLEEFERNVLIGSIAAGGVVLLIFIACAICHCRNWLKRKSEPNFDMFSGGSRRSGRPFQYEVTLGAEVGKESQGTSITSASQGNRAQKSAQVDSVISQSAKL